MRHKCFSMLKYCYHVHVDVPTVNFARIMLARFSHCSKTVVVYIYLQQQQPSGHGP